MPYHCCEHADESFHKPLSHAEYNAKYHHITDDPDEYLSSVQSRLKPDLAQLRTLQEDYGFLSELTDFLCSWGCDEAVFEQFEEHGRSVEMFIEHGLVDSLVGLLCSEEFWAYTTSMIGIGISRQWLQVIDDTHGS